MKRRFFPLIFPAGSFAERWAMILVLTLTCGVNSSALVAQQPLLYTDAEVDFSRMVKEYDQGLYGRSLRSAQLYTTRFRNTEGGHFIAGADLYALKSGLRLDQPGITEEILAFAELHAPAVESQKALMLLGENAYDHSHYDDAIHYLSRVDSRTLSVDEQSALHLKLGYCLFVRQEFDQASSLFSESKEVRNKYYYPSNYYYGMTRYFAGDYEDAIRHFERVAPSEMYKDYVPYYITQIYFSRGEYDRVIGYGEQALREPSVLNKLEIHHLLGQACFEKGDYEAAIPHLAYVEQHSAKLSLDDFYQLGLAYYHTGKFQDAIPAFGQIRNEPGEKAHYANYYLGHCYLNTGDKVAARNSLMQAARRTDVPSIAIEATYHYGRLSAEAGDDVEAIRVLQTILPASPDYSDAQRTLSDILTQTHDYQLAIRELEAMPSRSPVMQAAYQKVCLLRAEQLLQEGKTDEASALLDIALKHPADRSIQARCYFWKGELAHQHAQYTESIKWFDQYFSVGTGLTSLPLIQSLPVGQYTQGYNYLRNAQFAEAQKWFEEALSGLRSVEMIPGQANLLYTQVLPDALLRAGDCAFKRNQYDRAIQRYDESISRKWPGKDYAVYQKAVIRGLQQQPKEKIRLLEALVKEDPASLWADDALFQLGSTFQDEGQIPKAILSYEQLVNRYGTKSPLLLPALLRLGLLHYNSGRFEEALVHYKSVFQHNPDATSSREAISAIQEIYVNEWDKPDAFFEFAATIPGYAVSGAEKDSILYLAAENHYAEGEYEKAVASFEKYVMQNPKGLYTLKAMYLQAESLALLKRYSEALVQYEKVIEKGQSTYYASSLYKAALIAFNHTRDMAKAFSHYSAYLPVAESEERTYEALAGSLRCAYALEQAEDVYRIADELIRHPRTTDDILAHANYNVAKMALKEGNTDKALVSFNEVIRIQSAELAAEARYQIAWIYQQRGEKDIAAKLAEEAARANVGYPFWVAKSLMLLSDIQYLQGDFLNSRAILEAILENFQGDSEIMAEAKEKLEQIKTAEMNQSRIKPPVSDTLELQQNPKKD